MLLVFSLLITSLPPIIDEASAQADTSGNSAPVANDDSYNVNIGEVLTIAAPGVIGNDTYSDIGILTVKLVDDPTNGTLALNADGSFTYINSGSATATDSFAYMVNDGTADSNVATVAITINNGNNLLAGDKEAQQKDSLPVANEEHYNVNLRNL